MNTTTRFRVLSVCLGLLVAAILAGLAGCGGSSSERVIVMATPTATVTPIVGSSGAVICNGSPKTTDQYQDLVVKSGVCTIPAGKWVFNNVNIYGTGTCPDKATCNPGILRFDDVVTDFYAKSILVENGGSLIAGLDSANNLKPIGASGGRLTIHLYGKDQGIGGAGIACQSPTDASTGPCGIPLAIWNNDHTNKVSFDNGVSDYFYQYEPLPFDDGTTDGQVGYFGYKVLAVSYGGTLQLFGNKGAVYPSEQTPAPKSSGRSWGRLAGSIYGPTTANPGGDQTLTVDSPLPLDWQMGDHIVVTSTDYLADHAEELVIDQPPTGNTIHFTAACSLAGTCKTNGVQWTHNGERFSLSALPARLKISKCSAGMPPSKCSAETRAAVGLLTRSIQIVSEGDTYSDPFYQVGDPNHPNYFFGGHAIFRQGFEKVQVQGVEFKQLGQGGKLAHYPVHFHLCRQLPADTYVKDSSIDESMTRWITVHGTQGVTLARNVGYKSIGAGFYLEDGVETDNKLYSNLGVFARAGIMNADNPRSVPGILASPDPNPAVKFDADKDTPAVFWITNGWNDFQGNMAAGAGMCGVCYWELPASIGGPSRHMKWESYASEQTLASAPSRVGSSPLRNFDGNYCTSAMSSFQTVGYTQNCPGVGPGMQVLAVTNQLAPNSGASSAAKTCGPGTQWPICPDDYYPQVHDGDLGQATKCPATGVCDQSTAPLCVEDNETNCLPTVINDYTTSFNYSQTNFAAVWLRLRWHLVSNSFISDVQNAGLTFVSGGDYTHSSAINGLWDTAMKTAFVGQTQPQDAAHAYASVLSPFNNDTGLTCDNTSTSLYCISVKHSFVLGGFSGFAINERMFSIYDGPANEDSNAFLDIKRYDLGAPPKSNAANGTVYNNLVGIPIAVNAVNDVPKGDCYIPNAAIAWKQPNGFYYPPTFHSRNLFFNNVDIRHYVIDPFFEPGTYNTNTNEAMKRYCTYNSGIFNGFSSIDRETELTDDDGSLTGYAKTISVNEDPFFAAPVDGPECESDDAVPEAGTARTSPYGYVTTVVYPDCATTNTCGNGGAQPQTWGSDCSNPGCYGVPLYREDLTGSETGMKPVAMPNLRMAGMQIYQRETMTVNHGHYYIDTTPSQATQLANIKGNVQNTYCITPFPGTKPPPPMTPVYPCALNVFQAGQTYNVFLVYGSPDIEQTYQLYVGPGLNWDTVKKTSANVNLIRANVVGVPFTITPGTGGDANTLKLDYDGNILTVTLNLSAYASDYASATQNLCLPQAFCTYDTTAKKCVGTGAGTGTLFPSLTQAEQDLACTYAGKDIDCPTGGCVGFSVAMPSGFVAQDQTTTDKLLAPLLGCFPKDTNWDIFPAAALPNLAGSCADAPLNRDFCPATPGTESYGPDGLFSAAQPARQLRE